MGAVAWDQSSVVESRAVDFPAFLAHEISDIGIDASHMDGHNCRRGHALWARLGLVFGTGQHSTPPKNLLSAEALLVKPAYGGQ